ncbi:DUF3450 domain-containing protein [Vibrio eleionomae]
MKMMKPSLVLISLAAAMPVFANSLEDAKSIEHNTNVSSAVSQKKVDKSAQASIELRAEVEHLKEETKNLEVYRDHLKGLVSSQHDEMNSLNDQIAEIKTTRQGIVPLMYDMLDGLDALIKQDKPVRLETRQQRLAKLKALMPRADVSDAEKFRRILEAYQIEMDYGTKLGTYQGRIALSQDQQVEADVLYLGLVSLVARNLSQTRYWSWNAKQNQWQELDSGEKESIDRAFKLANQEIAPSFLTLPVSLTKAEAK